MHKKLSVIIALIGFASICIPVSCSDFITGGKLDRDPNRTVELTEIFQSFTAIQAAMFVHFTGFLARSTSGWMEQMGTADYALDEQMHSQQWRNTYTGGGLIDIQLVRRKADLAENHLMAGIIKFWEAYLMGMTASIWGDIPYSEANKPDITEPKLDKQADVYAAMQALLDEAIADLNNPIAGTSSPGENDPKGNDFVFGGDADKWLAAAHTLKARFYMHWAEVDASNYAKALTEAQMGISSPANNLKTTHTGASTESSLWYQSSRSSLMGYYCVNLLDTRNDPRLSIYFAEAIGPHAGQYVGSKPNEGNTNASKLSAEYLDAAHSTDLVTWEETQYIIAECQYQAENEIEARAVMNGALAGIEARYSLADQSLPRYDDTVTGSALLKAIMIEKYIAMFLNIEVWNDWKRTNIPDDLLAPVMLNVSIPRRLYYSIDERNANSNIPATANQPLRNDNDPN